jgi:hypothetical protein
LAIAGFCIASLRGVEEMCETLFIDPFDLVFCQIEHNIDLFFCKKRLFIGLDFCNFDNKPCNN